MFSGVSNVVFLDDSKIQQDHVKDTDSKVTVRKVFSQAESRGLWHCLGDDGCSTEKLFPTQGD